MFSIVFMLGIDLDDSLALFQSTGLLNIIQEKTCCDQKQISIQ